MKKLNLIVIWVLALYSHLTIGASNTTAYLLPNIYKTTPMAPVPLVPYSTTNINELNGQIGYSFSIPNSNTQNISIPTGKVGFLPPQNFNTYPLPGGGTTRVIQVNPSSFWEANFPNMNVQLNNSIKEGCHTYTASLVTNPPVYQLQVDVPQGVQFLALNTALNGQVTSMPYLLQNQILSLPTLPSTNVKLNICHYLNDEATDPSNPSTSCLPLVKSRVNELAKKSIFGPLISSTVLGSASAVLGAGAVYLMGENLPAFLVNILGREILKQPTLALAPVAGAVGIAVSALTFVGHEAIVITKLVNAANVLKSLKMAQGGTAKKSWTKTLDRYLRKKTVRGWDSQNKKALLGSAIKRMNAEGLLCNGELKSKRVQRKKNKKLRHLIPSKKEILKYIKKNTDYLK